MERERLCYGGGHFNGGRMINVNFGQFNRGKIVTLWRWPV